MKTLRYASLLFMAVLVATACAPNRAAPPGNGPALAELGRMQASGRLDPARMSCVVAALVPVTEVTQDEIQRMRRERAFAAGLAIGEHAESVQQGMRASDVVTYTGRQTQALMESAATLRSNGETYRAAQVSLWAMDVRRYAVEAGEIAIYSNHQDALWSNDDATLLVEYAALRADQAAASFRSGDIADRLADIEEDSPAVVDWYTQILLTTYRDPDLPCEAFTG